MASRIGRGPVILAFATIYAIWGSTYLALALALQSLPPFLLVGARSVAGGLILLGIEQSRGGALPRPGAWMPAALGGLLLFVGCHGSLAYAQQYVPSGLAAVMIATVPFWFVLLNFALPVGRRPNIASLFGLIPGLAGVALIAWRRVSPGSSSVDPAMVLLLLGSALSWAAGSLVGQRRAAGVSAIALAGMQLVCGGAVLLAASGLVGEWKEFTLGGVSAISWAGFAYLTLVVPENSIRQDSRCEGESDHHPMRCLRSFICSEHLSPICSSRGAGLKLRTSFCVISSTLS
jgi:drug/metabolite transporter (DMT)-like permease